MRRRAFTFVELIIGMVITALVLTALATVSTAVSVNWRTADAVETNFLAGSQVQARLAQLFRGAPKLDATVVGTLVSSGSEAAVFFWTGDQPDVTYPNGDGKIQFNEIGLIHHDKTSKELRLHTVGDWDSWSSVSQTAANALAGSGYIGTSANMSDFRQACANYRVLVRNVDGLVFKSYTTAESPMLEYVIRLQRPDGANGTYYGTITLRAPITPSN